MFVINSFFSLTFSTPRYLPCYFEQHEVIARLTFAFPFPAHFNMIFVTLQSRLIYYKNLQYLMIGTKFTIICLFQKYGLHFKKLLLSDSILSNSSRC